MGDRDSKECKNSYIRVCFQTVGKKNGTYYGSYNGTWNIQGGTTISQSINDSKLPPLNHAIDQNACVQQNYHLLCSRSIGYDVGCIFGARYKSKKSEYTGEELENIMVYDDEKDYNIPTLAYGTVRGYCTKWERGASVVDELVCNQAIDTDENGCQAIVDFEDTSETACKTLDSDCAHFYN